jgi:predicted RNase H-like HicB family nuclease
MDGMKIKVIVHKAEEGGFWAEVPALPGCVSQGETMEDLQSGILEAIEGCLAVEVEPPSSDPDAEVVDLAI